MVLWKVSMVRDVSSESCLFFGLSSPSCFIDRLLIKKVYMRSSVKDVSQDEGFSDPSSGIFKIENQLKAISAELYFSTPFKVNVLYIWSLPN